MELILGIFLIVAGCALLYFVVAWLYFALTTIFKDRLWQSIAIVFGVVIWLFAMLIIIAGWNLAT